MIEAPLVSVTVVTYNHEKFIIQCLEGILMQKTNFPYEIIIGEDCSMDSTLAKILPYKEKYPEIINLLRTENNLGMRENGKRVFANARGKYIASCEGDDYWIDPLKLQKQVDYMEANPQISMCFHNAFIIWEDIPVSPSFFCTGPIKNEYTTKDLLQEYNIPTASRMCRTEVFNTLPAFSYNLPVGDIVVDLFCSLLGNIAYLDEPMCVYRKHRGGWTFRNNQRWTQNYQSFKEFFDHFDSYTERKFSESINSRLAPMKKSKLENRIVGIVNLPQRVLKLIWKSYKTKLMIYNYYRNK